MNTYLIKRFGKNCQNQYRRCVVLIFPYIDSMRAFQKNGSNLIEWVIEPLKKYISVCDAARFFVDTTKDQGICLYVGDPTDYKGHYNSER